VVEAEVVEVEEVEIEGAGTEDFELDEVEVGAAEIADVAVEEIEMEAAEVEDVGVEVEDAGVEAAEVTEPEEDADTEEVSAPAPVFQFGKRDPHEKAQRLARVLVSDMIMYNPERHDRALAGGTLRDDFDDEIKKSWEEYVAQIGEEIAQGTSYFTDALNDILAKGEQIFEGTPPS
jgi:hypothetical protein